MGNTTNMRVSVYSLLLLVLTIVISSAHRGHTKCADGSSPTCSDGSAPVFDGDMTTPPCTDGGRPSTCTDGSTPTRLTGGMGKGRGRRCAKSERVCCDGSTPVFDGDRTTPPCEDGSRPKCSQLECELL